MKKVELLAPAKDKQTAITAINSGCDAIYIGAQNFGARKKVGNSLEDIKEIVEGEMKNLLHEMEEEHHPFNSKLVVNYYNKYRTLVKNEN